ncbi:MAG: DUF4352 domain-containing protein [Acidimicrobiaceae bacterium]|nr:DUF4352 domain-containing protein [Acidimicrobiaceae bacterium]
MSENQPGTVSIPAPKKSRKKLWIIIGFVVLLFIIIGVASSSSSPNSSTTAATVNSGTTGTTNAPGSTPTTASKPHLGATEIVKDQNGHAYTVQAISVTDPATASDQFNAANAGDRLVAVNLVLTNKSSAVIQDDADVTTTVVGSDNQTYQASFDTVNGCTNFNSGQFTLTAGASSSGCVVFDIPTAVKVTSVVFQPTTFGSNVVATWLVP